MNRHQERTEAFKIIYESNFGKSIDDILAMRADALNKNDSEYIISVCKGVADKRSEIDEKIDSLSDAWKLNRLSKVSLAILELSFYEILYIDSIPSKVSANEAVELAKEFDDPSAAGFINGILSGIISDDE